MSFDVIIPSKNSVGTLPRCMLGLVNSDFPFERVHVIDKYSRDGSREIAERYGCGFIEGPWNYTQALLKGVEVANTEYVLILDSDIMLNSQFYSKLEKIYRGKIVSKGIYMNNLPERYKAIRNKDLEYFTHNIGGLDAAIVHRKTFRKILEAILKSPTYKNIDAGSDTLIYQICSKWNLPVHQDTSIVNLHLVSTPQRLWRNTRWYGKNSGGVSLGFMLRYVKEPIQNLVKYRDLNLFFSDLVRSFMWVLGRVSG